MSKTDLSPRERQVWDLAISGKTAKEIARELGSSHRTVETQLANARQKLRDLGIVVTHLKPGPKRVKEPAR